METRVLRQEVALGLIRFVEPDRESLIFHALLPENATGCEPAKPPNQLVQEAEQAPAADYNAPLPRPLGAWTEERALECDGLEAGGFSFEVSGFTVRRLSMGPTLVRVVSSIPVSHIALGA